jgi:hypothetical protein
MWAGTHAEPDVERETQGGRIESCKPHLRVATEVIENLISVAHLPCLSEVTHNELGHYDIPLSNNATALHVKSDPKPVCTTALYGVLIPIFV